MIFVGISVFWQALFIFKVLISLITSLELVSLQVTFIEVNESRYKQCGVTPHF